MKSLAFLLYLAVPAATWAASATVSNETQLISALNGAVNGDVITMNAGTYTLSSAQHFGGDPNICIDLGAGITIAAAAGASPVISCNNPFGIRIRVSNVTLDGLTISGTHNFGIQAQDDAGHSQITGIVIRRVTVNSATDLGSVGISGSTMVDSIIEYCNVFSTDAVGIALGVVPGATGGSLRNLIVNNTVQNSGSGHGIGVTRGDYNIVAGNTISNLAADGVIVNGGQHNYIAQNVITNPANGVTLTKDTSANRQSLRNFVVNNSLALNVKPGSDSVWFNYDSNYNLAFLNDGSNAQENGMALFNSVGNYVRGNNFHNNPQGGVFVSKDPASGPTTPQFNSIQQNYLHDHAANGGINTFSETQNDFGFNYISGDAAQINTAIAGILAKGTINSNFYSNVIRDLRQAEQIQGGTTGAVLYLNRHINTVAHLLNTDSSAQFDSGSTTLGGNYYSDFTGFSANPSTGAPQYTNITDQNSGHPVNDRYPYSSENLGKNYSIAVRLPSAGSYLAASTQKTISWSSQGCVAVDLFLVDGSNSVVSTIASNSPDSGFYRWNVPAVAAGTYKVRADCKTSGGTSTGRTSVGAAFQITPPDLVLLSPQSNLVIDSTIPLRVAWKKTSNVLSVDVYVRYSDSQAFTAIATGITADSYTLPTQVTSSNRASVRIAYGGYSDSTDGWFTVRASPNSVLTSPASAGNLFIGTPALVEWIAPQNTDYVTIDLIGSSTKNIVSHLGDFSSYLMLVPDLPGPGAQLRLTFYNSADVQIQQLSSPVQNVQNSSAQPDAIAISAGNSQSAAVNTSFATPPQVVVTNSVGTPVSGVPVVFSAPASGASGSFSGSTTVVTNGSGVATATAFTANGTTGTYNVTATSGSLSATFTLTNTAGTTSTQTNVGYFFNSNFVLDANGSGAYEAPPADKFFFYVSQQPGDIAVVGDWNGNGRTKVGIYRNGFWILDYNGNGVYDYDGTAANDKFYGFGGTTASGYVPVVGDWNGDGRTKIGFYKGGSWALDYNGNGTFDGAGPGQDRFYGFGGNANEFPILGDWNHDGRTKVGVFYNGNFVLDYDGNGTYTAADKFYPYISYTAADRPVVGDWSGNGFSKIGIYRNGFWVLDYNGNGVYDGTGVGGDKFYGFGGNTGEIPIVGDWNGDGRSKVGFYLRGFWALDYNGNGSFDGTGVGQDRFIGFGGNAGEQPLIGKW